MTTRTAREQEEAGFLLESAKHSGQKSLGREKIFHQQLIREPTNRPRTLPTVPDPVYGAYAVGAHTLPARSGRPRRLRSLRCASDLREGGSSSARRSS